MWPSGRWQKTVNLPWRNPHRKFESYSIRKLILILFKPTGRIPVDYANKIRIRLLKVISVPEELLI